MGRRGKDGGERNAGRMEEEGREEGRGRGGEGRGRGEGRRGGRRGGEEGRGEGRGGEEERGEGRRGGRRGGEEGGGDGEEGRGGVERKGIDDAVQRSQHVLALLMLQKAIPLLQKEFCTCITPALYKRTWYCTCTARGTAHVIAPPLYMWLDHRDYDCPCNTCTCTVHVH